MSIYVTITRKPNPHWKSGDEIPYEEWREAALAERDFRPPTSEELVEPFSLQTDLVWTKHPEHPAVWFSWQDGQIDVKYLDEITIARMMTLASKLQAQIISEQGERFDTRGRSLGLFPLPNEPHR